MLQGIDVSAYQHPAGAAIDWAAVKGSGVEAVYVEATQGTDGALSNPYLAQDVQGAVSVGLHVGAYHFAYPALNSWQAESAWFRARIAGLPLDLPPVLDFETPGGLSSQALADWAQAWLGDFPASMLYCYRSLYAALPGAPWGRPVWMAIPGGTLGNLAGVQYATAPVPGVPVDPDLDHFDPAILEGTMTPEQAAQLAALWAIFFQPYDGDPTHAPWSNMEVTRRQLADLGAPYAPPSAVPFVASSVAVGSGLTAAQDAELTALAAAVARIEAALKGA
ncbi:MAG TPA: glycoside hydrolase family 25 protein [Candidatus Saccharimonadales bacterium]|nr:glycoside hydrolase family 25 protein [Candidatus Saccharimonadales bacterium]